MPPLRLGKPEMAIVHRETPNDGSYHWIRIVARPRISLVRNQQDRASRHHRSVSFSVKLVIADGARRLHCLLSFVSIFDPGNRTKQLSEQSEGCRTIQTHCFLRATYRQSGLTWGRQLDRSVDVSTARDSFPNSFPKKGLPEDIEGSRCQGVNGFTSTRQCPMELRTQQGSSTTS